MYIFDGLFIFRFKNYAQALPFRRKKLGSRSIFWVRGIPSSHLGIPLRSRQVLEYSWLKVNTQMMFITDLTTHSKYSIFMEMSNGKLFMGY